MPPTPSGQSPPVLGEQPPPGSQPKNVTLTPVQIYALARNAGLPSSRAAVATAIALAESSGETAVTSRNPDGGTNVGLWQLDTPGGLGSGYTVTQLQDPFTNAKAMAAGSSKGADFSAWQTFVQGTWENFHAQAWQAADQEAAQGLSGGDWLTGVLKTVEGAAKDVGKDIKSWLGHVLSLPSQVTDFFDTAEKLVHAALWLTNPANWVRIMAGLAGAVLVGLGIFTLARAA